MPLIPVSKIMDDTPLIFHEFIKLEAEADYIEKFENLLKNGKYVEKVYGKREVIQFGYKYEYGTNYCTKTENHIPDYLKSILKDIENKLIEINIIQEKEYFNQCIVNKYQVGEKISAHKDARCFDDVIVTLSLSNSNTMLFKNDHRTLRIPLPVRSLLVLYKETRNLWTHELSPQKTGIRYSITFRRFKM
jgi:alkylated DNA repair dioxygenase AlkB